LRPSPAVSTKKNTYLKKQTQFSKHTNGHKTFYNRSLRPIGRLVTWEKANPNKPNFRRLERRRRFPCGERALHLARPSLTAGCNINSRTGTRFTRQTRRSLRLKVGDRNSTHCLNSRWGDIGSAKSTSLTAMAPKKSKSEDLGGAIPDKGEKFTAVLVDKTDTKWNPRPPE